MTLTLLVTVAQLIDKIENLIVVLKPDITEVDGRSLTRLGSQEDHSCADDQRKEGEGGDGHCDAVVTGW